MAAADRAVTRVVERYRAGVSQFVAARVAPLVTFISSGEASVGAAPA
jgi:hypothetical protein